MQRLKPKSAPLLLTVCNQMEKALASEREEARTSDDSNLSAKVWDVIISTLLMVSVVWFQTQTGPTTRFKWYVVWFKSQPV